MNAAKAIEWAVASTLHAFADLGPDTTVRPWQSIGADGYWDKNKDRDFPVVDVRCSSPSELLPERTRYLDCTILCGTKAQDDKDHSVLSALYGECERVALALYDQACPGDGGAEYTHFEAALGDQGGAGISIGGITLGDGVAPEAGGAVNMLGITLRFDYARL